MRPASCWPHGSIKYVGAKITELGEPPLAMHDDGDEANWQRPRMKMSASSLHLLSMMHIQQKPMQLGF